MDVRGSESGIGGAANGLTDARSHLTTAEGIRFEPTRLSYAAAAGVARRIAVEVAAQVRCSTVVVVGTPLLVDFTNLAGTLSAIAALEQDYAAIPAFTEALMAPPVDSPPVEAAALANLVEPVVAPLLGAASQALGLLTLLGEDVEYEGAETVVDPLSFEISLASELKAGGAKEVILPQLFVTHPEALPSDGLRKAMEQVHAAKAAAWEAVAPWIGRLVEDEAKLDRALQTKTQAGAKKLSAEVAQRRNQLDPVSELLAKADRRLAELEHSLAEAVENQGLTRLGRLLRAEAILAAYPEAEYVHAKIVASGGHQRISRNLLRMLFFGDGLSFRGGVVARWALLGKSGSVKKGGIRWDLGSSGSTRWSDLVLGFFGV